MSAARTGLVLAIAIALAAPVVQARGGAGGGRMATSSISSVNRPAHLPARPAGGANAGEARRTYYGYPGLGWYWYDEYDEPEREPEPAPEPAAPPPPPPPPPSVGTTLLALPAGCSTVERGGKFLRSCGGAFYEEKFEGDRIVYTVVQ